VTGACGSPPSATQTWSPCSGSGWTWHKLFALIAAGVLTPGQLTAYELADGPKALAELETGATVGKLALLP
jgi:hypothetical protein